MSTALPQAQATRLSGKLAFVLLERILTLIKDSGANQRESKAALKAALAMLPEADLQIPAKMATSIET